MWLIWGRIGGCDGCAFWDRCGLACDLADVAFDDINSIEFDFFHEGGLGFERADRWDNLWREGNHLDYTI